MIVILILGRSANSVNPMPLVILACVLSVLKLGQGAQFATNLLLSYTFGVKVAVMADTKSA